MGTARAFLIVREFLYFFSSFLKIARLVSRRAKNMKLIKNYKLGFLVLLAGALTACNANGTKTAYLQDGGINYYPPSVDYPTGPNQGNSKTNNGSTEQQTSMEGMAPDATMDNDVRMPIENPFIDLNEVEARTSNLSLTSTSFAYTTIRQAINQSSIYRARQMVKTEEMLNYFSYGYVNDTDDALTTHLELGDCPWNAEHKLASVVVKAKPAVTENVKNNIVILIDRSGSMTGIFNLVKTSLNTMVDKLGDDDIVSIVSYASGCSVEADGFKGSDKAKLRNVINGLTAGGSTWGEGGIEKAYEVAYKHFISGGNNRVVILTDGDFNVGKVSGEELTKLIKQKASDGVYLTCCGYRSYDNNTLYTLADNGNGNAYYIDCELEAKKVFEEELGKSLYVVAKDAKCQIEFSDAVASYRLIGYESRQMSDDEFNDEQKDAGEIMADHTTVALYELDVKDEYQDDNIFKTVLRYKDPISQENKEVVNKKVDASVSRQVDFDFASYVAEYSLILMQSKYKENASYDHLLERINNNAINDKYRDDFVSLVRATRSLDK